MVATMIFAVVIVAVLVVTGRMELKVTNLCVDTQRRIRINRWGLARRARDWDRLVEIQADESIANLPLAVDLDLFGHASLMQLLCTAQTEEGISTLVRWLVEPSDPPEVRRRQRVCEKLAPSLDWRQELQRHCIAIGDHADQTRRFKSWAQESAPIKLPSPVRKYVLSLRLLAPLVLACFVVYPAAATVVTAVLLLINVALTVAYSGAIHTFFRKILVTSEAHCHSYLSDTFSHLSNSDELRATMPDVVSACHVAVAEFKRLERILRLESISSNPMTVWFFYIPLQFVLLWDLQLFMHAEAWRKVSGGEAPRWFDLLGEVETLCSLASLSYEQPGWQFPELIDSNVPTFVAKDLGHPLLPDRSRVANDIRLGPPGRLQLITGSNMGGKSTLLRAIGVNAVLAQAGAPCCCQSLKMSPLKVMTSMRVLDSLSDSTSMFMAQLLNLKRIVDQLRSTGDGEQGRPLMYLFDEILNGTNTSDRRLAVESLVGYLLGCRAIGAMTTHDLEIARESKHRGSFETHYLAHQLAGDQTNPMIKYDYKLRPGVAPRSNAMLLLRLLGLPEE